MTALFLLLACASPDYGLSPHDQSAEGPPLLETAPAEPQGAAAEDPPPAVQAMPDGSATSSWTVGPDRRDDFVLGSTLATPLVDFLFVVDPSSSMKRVLEQFQAGITGLAARGAFPSRSRIAVMSTTPGDFDDLRQPHPAVRHRTHARRIPGFLALVSGASISRYRAWARDEHADRFAEPGCGPWFSPEETNTRGTPCLLAHAQPALVTVWVEDGLLAFRQLLDKVGAHGLFRAGAAANVVILSDTHGPGFVPAQDDFQAQLWHEQLLAAHPTLAELQDELAAEQDLASFRVHAVVPRSGCGERKVVALVDPDEVDVALESGGVVADICTVDDYAAVLEQILATGAQLQQPVLALSSRADAVHRVAVDGRPVAHTLGTDGRTVLLERLPPADATVRIEYRPRARRAPGAPTR